MRHSDVTSTIQANGTRYWAHILLIVTGAFAAIAHVRGTAHAQPASATGAYNEPYTLN